jgi:hypothetical protein
MDISLVAEDSIEGDDYSESAIACAAQQGLLCG